MSIERRIELALSCPGDRAMTAAIARLPRRNRLMILARFGAELAGLARADYARLALPAVAPELATLAARSCLLGDLTIRDVALAASVSFRQAYMATDRFTMQWARDWDVTIAAVEEAVASLDDGMVTNGVVLKRPDADQRIAREVLSGGLPITSVAKTAGMSAKGVSKAVLRWIKHVDPAFRSIVMTVSPDCLATWRGLPFLTLASRGVA